MNTRTFHGELVPNDIARILIARYNRGNLHAQQFGSGNRVVVQIASTSQPISGGQTAITVYLERVVDGVSIQLGKQSWLGVAASLSTTAFWAWRNPWNLLSRLDDLAQDFENLQLVDGIWETIENYAQAMDATFELSERLKRMVCNYCNTANPVGESRCIACGAPLGDVQPITCKNCGYILKKGEVACPNCGTPVFRQKPV
jgi:RNase P subunit RPR2